MSVPLRFASFAVVGIASFAPSVHAQTAKMGQGKGKIVPQKKQNAPTLGTVQMPGDNGKIGTTYQLGDKGSELHFNLESATLETIHPAPDELLVAGAKQRLLALTFNVQNPLNREQTLGSSDFHFTAVSPDDENFEFRGKLLSAAKGTSVYQSLKPAQKVKCTVVFPIYATGPVTKVIVQRGNAAVLRYDLTGKVGKMTSVFTTDGIDLGDKAKMTLDDLKKGTIFGPLQIEFVSGEASTGLIQNEKPPQGERYWTMKMRFTNPLLRPADVGFQYYTPELLTEDGEKLSWAHSLLNASGENYLSQTLQPGDSIVALYYFRVPMNKRPATLRFTHNDSNRTIEFPAAW